MENKKKLQVTFAGKAYTISTDEKEEVVFRAARLVDELLGNYSQKMPSADISQKALLIAFQLATDLSKHSDLLELYETKTEELNSIISENL